MREKRSANREPSQVAKDLFSLFTDLTNRQQDEIQEMLEVGHLQFGTQKCAIPFVNLARHTLSKSAFAGFTRMVIDGSTEETATRKPHREIRARRKLKAA